MIGSFLNVVIYRVPLGISIAKGRSYCPSCNTQLKNYDLIPIFSYLFLRGKCRKCGSKISLRYPLVELVTGILAVFIFLIVGFSWQAVLIFAVTAIMLAISLIDLDTMTIPNGLLIALIPFITGLFFLQPELALLARIIGFLALSLPMFLLNFVVEDSFGGGDIKLMALAGFMLGWQQTLVAFFIALMLGGSLATYLLLTKQKEKGSHIPFGPYLCIGIFLALLFGEKLLSWYLNLLF
ncbi:MAG: prepilin peptidase [Clostridia bacterium]